MLYVEKQGKGRSGRSLVLHVSYGGAMTWRVGFYKDGTRKRKLPDGTEKIVPTRLSASAKLGDLAGDEPRRGAQGGAQLRAARASAAATPRRALRRRGGTLAERAHRARGLQDRQGVAPPSAIHGCRPSPAAACTTSIRTTSPTCSTTSPRSTARSWPTTCWRACGTCSAGGAPRTSPTGGAARHRARHAQRRCRGARARAQRRRATHALAADRRRQVFSGLVRMLLLTGQRLETVRTMRWSRYRRRRRLGGAGQARRRQAQGR